MTKIPQKVEFRGNTYSFHSSHKKKEFAKREENKVRIEGHHPIIKSFDQKHVVYVKKEKLTPMPDLREKYKTINGEKYTSVIYSETKKGAKEYAKKYKGVLFGNYRIFREKTKDKKNRTKIKHVIYAKKLHAFTPWFKKK